MEAFALKLIALLIALGLVCNFIYMTYRKDKVTAPLLLFKGIIILAALAIPFDFNFTGKYKDGEAELNIFQRLDKIESMSVQTQEKLSDINQELKLLLPEYNLSVLAKNETSQEDVNKVAQTLSEALAVNRALIRVDGKNIAKNPEQIAKAILMNEQISFTLPLEASTRVFKQIEPSLEANPNVRILANGSYIQNISDWENATEAQLVNGFTED